MKDSRSFLLWEKERGMAPLLSPTRSQSGPRRPEIKGTFCLVNTLVKFTIKRAPMLKGQLRPGSLPALPRGWRNSFSIQRASERNECERALSPYFHHTSLLSHLPSPSPRRPETKGTFCLVSTLVEFTIKRAPMLKG
ncbi:hypothetical protein SAMN05443529_108129 [Desulfosporosinus hippei DSM 8344]|uniref:Uncharacterized protein n=1 Tax=Desulfosporosinus hippei DSM 8344 TaxID=1121419 RepID=A0A1G7YRK2_9FIRM|nr:hypothetical protein SAMN05443529_108129 [Desulfosporosinus hippei DSM 8344]